MHDVNMQDVRIQDRKIVGQASFLSIWVGPAAKKKRTTTAECCLSINNQSNQVLGHELSISR